MFLDVNSEKVEKAIQAAADRVDREKECDGEILRK